MEPAEIWKLILKADERLKYAAGGAGGSGGPDPRRREQAAALLVDALVEAEAIGDEGLATQARIRLDDLDHPP